jgi:hypothetical protein
MDEMTHLPNLDHYDDLEHGAEPPPEPAKPHDTETLARRQTGFLGPVRAFRRADGLANASHAVLFCPSALRPGIVRVLLGRFLGLTLWPNGIPIAPLSFQYRG